MTPTAADVAVHLARIRPEAELADRLTAAERERCSRYLRAADRDRFAGGRALLRAALGRDPSDSAVLKTAEGRPYLDPSSGPQPHISLSHSGMWAAVAICPGTPVGVDVEHLAEVDRRGFERLVCSPAEAARLAALTGDEAAAERLRIWTLKEALLKAAGSGFLTDPRGVDAAEGERAVAMPGVPHARAAVAVAVRGNRIGTVSMKEIRL